MTAFFDWRGLPHREIWCIDTEYYRGPGRLNGGREGDLITPLCLVAIELRSGWVVRRWVDELGPFPPYRLDAGALIVSFMWTAEAGFHLAKGWGRPAQLFDAYIEFRRITNDARIKSGDREKGFHSLLGASRYFGFDALDAATHKKDMRDRILDGPPFTIEERERILDYCESDTRKLADVTKRLIPLTPSLPHAVFRAEYAYELAKQERRGVPIDLDLLDRLRNHWDLLKLDLVMSIDREYNCYDIDGGGGVHFRNEKFQAYVRREGISWPMDNDRPDLKSATFRGLSGPEQGLWLNRGHIR